MGVFGRRRCRKGTRASAILIDEFDASSLQGAASCGGYGSERLTWMQNEWIESHVVDLASIATSRRRRRAKTDKIDDDGLVRAPLAYKRGESWVCAMVKAPTLEEEDRRRLCRERKVLLATVR